MISTTDIGDRLPYVRRIRRVEFPVKGIERLVEIDSYRIYLGRPKPLAEGVFPLRQRQRVSFDDWPETFLVCAVGEGFIDLWREHLRIVLREAWFPVRTMIRIPQYIEAESGAEYWPIQKAAHHPEGQ